MSNRGNNMYEVLNKNNNSTNKQNKKYVNKSNDRPDKKSINKSNDQTNDQLNKNSINKPNNNNEFFLQYPVYCKTNNSDDGTIFKSLSNVDNYFIDYMLKLDISKIISIFHNLIIVRINDLTDENNPDNLYHIIWLNVMSHKIRKIKYYFRIKGPVPVPTNGLLSSFKKNNLER